MEIISISYILNIFLYFHVIYFKYIFILFIYPRTPNTIHFHFLISIFLHDLILPKKIVAMTLIPNPRISYENKQFMYIQIHMNFMTSKSKC